METQNQIDIKEAQIKAQVMQKEAEATAEAKIILATMKADAIRRLADARQEEA